MAVLSDMYVEALDTMKIVVIGDQRKLICEGAGRDPRVVIALWSSWSESEPIVGKRHQWRGSFPTTQKAVTDSQPVSSSLDLLSQNMEAKISLENVKVHKMGLGRLPVRLQSSRRHWLER